MKLALAIVAVLLACRPHTSNTASTTTITADTLRGILVIEGSEPFLTPTLRTSAGRFVVDSAAPALLKLSNLDVWLHGTRADSNHFRVTSYRVRGANGAPAYDGTLRADSVGLLVDTEDGSSRRVRGAPSQLARLVGSRIWFTENVNGTLREYGVF